MFAFSIVRKIGEGNYLSEEPFIIERARKERALNMRPMIADNKQFKNRTTRRDGRQDPS
ncbi:MAG: hypothetical protein ABID09_04065 [Candidatus Omnitrophota bacterium]